jgi:hypothetical protein
MTLFTKSWYRSLKKFMKRHLILKDLFLDYMEYKETIKTANKFNKSRRKLKYQSKVRTEIVLLWFWFLKWCSLEIHLLERQA